MAKKINVVSLFSGIRGCDMGSTLAGGTTYYLNDIGAFAKRAFTNQLFENRPINDYMTSEGHFHHDNVMNLNWLVIFEFLLRQSKELAEVFMQPFFTDYALSGSCCQGLSFINRLRDYFLHINKLMFHQVNVLAQEVRPKVIVMEQVPGLLDVKMVEFYDSFKLVLRTVGREYVWRMQLMNSSRYGSHQDRDRLIFIGVHRDLGVEPSYPEPQPIRDESYMHNLLPNVTHIIEKHGNPISTYQKLPPTLTRGNIKLIENGVERYMTLEEKMRISYLEGFNFDGISISDRHVLMGNMVQVKFSEAICKHIIEEILPKCA